MRCHSFNQPVDNLPLSLTHLTFGFNFNQKLNNLPLSLTHLEVNFMFSHKLDNLPPTIKEIRASDKVVIKKPFECNIIITKASDMFDILDVFG